MPTDINISDLGFTTFVEGSFLFSLGIGNNEEKEWFRVLKISSLTKFAPLPVATPLLFAKTARLDNLRPLSSFLAGP